MKKLLLIPIIILGFIVSYVPVNAQSGGGYGGAILNNAVIGAKFSINYGFIHQNGFYDMKQGYSAGFLFNYQIIDLISVSTEPSYKQKGAKNIDLLLLYSENSPFMDRNYINTDLVLKTIEIPGFVNIYFPFSGNTFRTKILLGLSFDYILKAEIFNTTEKVVDESVIEIYDNSTITERIKQYDIGAIGGIGADLDLNLFVLSVDLRYRYGFSNINNVVNNDEFGISSISINFGVGF